MFYSCLLYTFHVEQCKFYYHRKIYFYVPVASVINIDLEEDTLV